MFDSREDIRQHYCKIYKRLIAGEIFTDPMEKIISEIIRNHPEYHSMLEHTAVAINTSFNPDDGQPNPFLHMGMHIAIQEQLGSNRPQGIKKEHRRLTKIIGEHEAEHQMMECLGESLWLAQRNNTLPDEPAYLECIRKL